MNEEELKEIWKKEQSIPLKNVNIELIRKRALESQNKLRKRIKWDIAVNVLLYVLISPSFFYFPQVLVVVPFAIAVWIWYLWELLRIYKHDANLQEFENVKSFLVSKEQLLTNYITRTRYLGYLGMPVIFSVCFVGMTSFDSIWKFPLNFFIGLIASEILVVILFEPWLRKIYMTVINELKELLQQLND